MPINYKEIALQMNRLYCIGEGHVAGDLLLDAIRNDNDDDDQPRNANSRKDFSDYVLFMLDRIRENLNKELTTLTNEIEKWIETQ